MRFRCEGVGPEGARLSGDKDVQGRYWLPARHFASTWAAYEALEAKEAAARTATLTERSRQQEAWRPLVRALGDAGLLPNGTYLLESPPTEDALELVLTRAQVRRILMALAVLAGDSSGEVLTGQ